MERKNLARKTHTHTEKAMDGRTDIRDVSLIGNFLEEVSNLCS